MRKVIGSAFLSLDGVMQAPGGPTEDPTGGFAHGGWLAPVSDQEVGAAVGELFAQPFDLLLGRRTYDIFAAFWPYVGQEGDDGGIGAALKATDGPDLLIQGSSTLYPALLAAGLLDRLTCMTFPVVLGHGKRLFGEGTPALTMRPLSHRVTTSGVVIATYEPGDSAATAAIAPPSTSDREVERQRRMRDGSW